MTHWVLLVAPLVVASLVMLLGFVGCSFHPGAAMVPTTPNDYHNVVTGDPNVVSYWRLGEPAGQTTAKDVKGLADGDYVGGVTLGTTGLMQNDGDTAVTFNGSSGYVRVPHRNELNPTHFTVEALVTLNGGAGSFRAVVSSRDIQAGNVFGYILYASDQNLWEAWVGDGTSGWKVLQGGEAADGTHFLAMTYDGTTLKLHVDPVVETTHVQTYSYQPNTNQELRIGAGANESASPLYFFPGVIDDVAVYGEALTPQTLELHYMMSLGGTKPA
jgi:Concanavalin A-like lectin/glucanases superfamily